MIFLFIFLLFLLLLMFGSYMSRNNHFWKKRGVPYIKPTIIFGNFLDVFLWRKSIGQKVLEIYKGTLEPYLGFFILDEPILLINDLDLIESILVKDFNQFRDRTTPKNEEFDPIGFKMSFFEKSPMWITARRRLLPLFTSSKMKSNFEQMKNSAKRMELAIRKSMETRGDIEIKEMLNKVTVDILVNSFYSIETHSFEEKGSPFIGITKILFNWKAIWHALQITYLFIAPQFKRLLRYKVLDQEVTEFFKKLTWDLLINREEENVKRGDLIDILVDIKKSQNVTDEYSREADFLSSLVIAAFVGSYETTSTTTSFALFELAKNIEAQKLIREEITKVETKSGNITYENLKELKYLERCLLEVMRLHPILPFLDRTCNEIYQLPGTELILEKGQKVYISVSGLGHNPKYYPDPSKFDPSRFENKNLKEKFKSTYLTFGIGPRACPGKRFALISMKIITANIIKNFEVKLAKNQSDTLKINPIGFLAQPMGGLFLKFSDIQQ
ncbi:hypothetical protein HHI36_006530 [Cryptolaemus montrouzieri]|uniref:Cytochrome P450 n=1 Tax=Cryptolaemus montrouzieri TaxID=559131 RepID=A0ABD2NXG8_9CUCU